MAKINNNIEDRFNFRIWDDLSKQMLHYKYFEYINDKSKVLQCTGLKDSKGNLIYEGDVVKALSERGFDYGNNIGKFFKVFWFKENGAWYIERDFDDEEVEEHKPYRTVIEMVANCDLEVAGNIFEL